MKTLLKIGKLTINYWYVMPRNKMLCIKWNITEWWFNLPLFI